MSKNDLEIFVKDWLADSSKPSPAELSIANSWLVEELCSDGAFGEDSDTVLEELHRLDAFHY